MSFKTLVFDEQPIVLEGVREACEQSEFQIYAVAHEARRASELVAQQRNDLVLLGTRLGQVSGFDFCRQQWQYLSAGPVLFLGDQTNSAIDTISAIDAGGFGLVPKSCTRDQLLQAMREVVAGHQLWSRADLKKHSNQKSRIRIDKPHAILTERENDVLLEISRGRTNAETAEALGIGYETVKDHVANILKKLEVTDRTQAAIWAVRNNVV